MKTLISTLLISFILLIGVYILLPLLLYWDAGAYGFSLWMLLVGLNLFGQPILIGSSIHDFFTKTYDKTYLISLLIIVNSILYLLPIGIICLLIFSDPLPFNYN